MTTVLLTYDEILQSLPAIIGDCLGIDEEEVQPAANFFDDLGGESIDQLDLSFRCEKAFGVKGPFQVLVELASTPLNAESGLPAAVLDEACQRLPFLRPAIDRLKSGHLQPLDLRKLFTVDLIARLIESKLRDSARA